MNAKIVDFRFYTKLYTTLKAIQKYAEDSPEFYEYVKRNNLNELITITSLRWKFARIDLMHSPEQIKQEVKPIERIIVDESYLWLNPGKEQTENKHCASCTSCTNHCSESHEHKTSTEQLIKRHFTDLISDFIRNTRKIS